VAVDAKRLGLLDLNYIALPWQKDLAGAQRVIFIVTASQP
jgi:hypothetical protein